MMYFATDSNNVVISHGKEPHPGAHSISESELPEWWYEKFIECRLGYTEERGFYVITEDEVALMGG